MTSQTQPALPLVRNIPTPGDPLAVFCALRAMGGALLLDSGQPMEHIGRHAFVATDPFLILTSRGDRIFRNDRSGSATEERGDPFEFLRRELDRYRLPPDSGWPPFPGGAAGYLSYDLGRHVERLPEIAEHDLNAPDLWLAFYDVVVCLDLFASSAAIVSTGFPATGSERVRRAEERIEQVAGALSGAAPGPGPYATGGEPTSPFARSAYEAAVQRCRDYIIDGDIFQVNLSQRFSTAFQGDPLGLYAHLRKVNPAPFAAFFETGKGAVVSASPERFLLKRGDQVQTRPIKGTRPRGNTPQEDLRLAEDLLNSDKDRAENTMIVDLLRNDLGRVCRPGSIRVTELCTLETFPTVFHLTSTVTGRLRSECDGVGLVKACFPGGSITGAPKVRAMEIIEELEPTRRSIYTGAIGYFGFDGSIDLNIAIRTLQIEDGRAHFQVGGGIVYDSDPRLEYEETLHKGRALAQALTAGREGG